MYPPEHGARKHLVHVVDIATYTDDGSMVVGASIACALADRLAAHHGEGLVLVTKVNPKIVRKDVACLLRRYQGAEGLR